MRACKNREVTSFEVASFHFRLNWPMDEAGGIEFSTMSAHKLKEGTGPWVAWTVDAARR